jgi:hypothetical protein
MTPGQLKSRLSRLGMGPRELAEAYGANPRTAQRWVTGKADIPKGVEQWLDEYEKAR